MTSAQPGLRKPRRVSLSEQAYLYLRGMIESGSYQPGERLPPQDELAAQVGISRLTVRDALRSLEQEGMIQIKHGVGTFVSLSGVGRLESGLERLESIVELVARQGSLRSQVTFGDLKVTQEPAGKELAAALQVPAGTLLTRVGRTFRVGSRPVAYMVDMAPALLLAPEEIDGTFDGSILSLLKRRSDLTLSYAVAEIQAITAGGELAARLKVKPQQVLQLLEETLYDGNGTPVEFSRNYFVPDFFQFRVVRR
ncbi:MAG: GntR family transcriptional regulator [Anaerolineae bacterium]|nr:GntR family transcriptional regulator [Anaerolineae bacterium]